LEAQEIKALIWGMPNLFHFYFGDGNVWMLTFLDVLWQQPNVRFDVQVLQSAKLFLHEHIDKKVKTGDGRDKDRNQDWQRLGIRSYI
jgi:hypothetical protein